MMGNLLSRDDILSAPDILVERVDVPEWGGTVLVMGMSGVERDAFEEESLVGKGKKREVNLHNLRARLVARSIVDEKRQRIFTESDAEALGKKSAAALQRVFNVAQRMAGLSDEDVEELAKNSESAPKGASTSD